MTPAPRRRLSARLAIELAIDSGRHRVDISPEGRVTILPLEVSLAQADDVALDAEIQEFMRDGAGGH